MTITALPTPPNSTDKTNFNARADAFLSALPNFVTEVNAAAAEINDNAANAATSASNAAIDADNAESSASASAISASNAAASAGAQLWVSGTTYAIGNLVWSPANGRIYRRKTAGAGTSDPSLDATNWTPTTLEISTGQPIVRPSLLLDFANSKQVDPRITFTRASSATYTDRNGVIKLASTNAPRIDHDPVTGECRGLLAEGARTNLLTYSEQFDNAAWTPISGGATVTINSTVSPDGTTNADLIDDTSNSVGQLVRQQVSIADDSTAYTFSIYVKKNTSRYVALWLSFSGGALRERIWTYDLDTITSQGGGINPATSGSIVDVGNGWRRITVTASNTTEGNTSLSCRLYPATSGLGVVNTATTGSVWAYGAQLENNNFATSYIPTVATQITRAADLISMTGVNFSRWYNDTQGSFLIDFCVTAKPSGVSVAFSVSDGTGNNKIDLRVSEIISGADFFVRSGAIITVDTSGFSVSDNTKYLVAIGVKQDDMTLCVNSAHIATDSSAAMPIAVNKLRLAADDFCGHIARFVYYSKRLSTSELLTISTK